MLVFDITYGFGEVTEIVFFGESGQLGDVVEADIDEALDAGIAERGEELLGGFFGEANGEEFHAVFNVGRLAELESSGAWPIGCSYRR